MTIPLWCLLAAVTMPFVWFTVAVNARKAQFGFVDNKHPRAQIAKLEGKGARAIAAHQNAFEALAIFTPAVLVALVAHANTTYSAALAIAWVVFRVLHGFFYITDNDKARSAVFGLAMLTVLGQFVIAAIA